MRLESTSRHLLFSIAIVFGLGVVVWSFLAVRTFTMRGELSDIEAEIVKLQPAVDKIGYYQSQTQKLRPRIECLEKARAETLYWRDLTDSLGHSMAKDTWLTALDLEQKTDPKLGRVQQLVVKGASFTQERVGITMMHMNRRPYFEDVKLEYTREATISGESLLDFEVVCRLPQDVLEVGKSKGRSSQAPEYNKPFPRGKQDD